jgi:sulfatase maturation enzyme AslB (radical SAM superfamily)
MILSINPTYYCNFSCDFCYLTKEQLADRRVVPLDILEKRIQEAQQHYEVSMIDLYGGEVGLLPETYVNDMCAMLNTHGIYDINIITNLSMVNDVILNPDLYITVSYDFDCREQHDRVWNNMFLLTKPFSVLVLAGPKMISKDVNNMIQQLNFLQNLCSVEVKPYSTNQANEYNVTHKDYEKFVQKWIDSSVEKKFQFINEQNIKTSIDGTRNAFSNDHIYITPEGRFAVLEFDLNDNEYFKSLNSIEEYIAWASSEPTKNVSNICKSCEYYGKCLTEHYRYVTSLDNGCNGYKNLLDWYKNERLETKTRNLS